MKKDNNDEKKIEISSFSDIEQDFVEEDQPMPSEPFIKRDEPVKKKKKAKEEKKEPVINMTDIRAARKKDKKKKLAKRLIILLIVAALGLAAYFSRHLWIGKLEGIFDRPHEIIVNDGKIQSGNFPIIKGTSAVNILELMDDDIVTADDANIFFYSENGGIESSFVHELEDPIVKIAGKRMLAFDNGGKVFKLYSKKEELYTKSIDDSILFAEVGSNGYVAVITQTEKYPACMSVYDENGSEIYRWSSGQRIIDVSFNDRDTGCYVTTFSSEGGELCSVVHYIKFNSSEEKMTSVKLDSLVIDTCENNNDGIWAVGDKKFYKLDENGKIIMEYEYTDDMVSYCINEYSAAVVVNSISKGKGTLALFDSEEDKVELAETNGGEPKALTASGRKVFLLGDRAVESYDMNGNCLATADVTDEYTNFVYLNDNVYLMGYRAIDKIEFNT
ncbi:MAG: hypothetical protein IJU04_05115 [Ruminococcus sp.]|nr:hypothetical protein [Ruminococcus sp.]